MYTSIALLIVSAVWLASCLYGIYRLWCVPYTATNNDSVKFNAKLVDTLSYVTEFILIVIEGVLIRIGITGDLYSPLIPCLAVAFMLLGTLELVVAMLQQMDKVSLQLAVVLKLILNFCIVSVVAFVMFVSLIQLLRL